MSLFLRTILRRLQSPGKIPLSMASTKAGASQVDAIDARAAPETTVSVVEVPSETAPAPLMQRLRQAAWNNHIADGELQQGYLAMRLEEAGKRAAHATRRTVLSVERDALEAELMAIIHQPAPLQPLPPEPRVLRPMPTVVPFAQGGKRHD